MSTSGRYVIVQIGKNTTSQQNMAQFGFRWMGDNNGDNRATVGVANGTNAEFCSDGRAYKGNDGAN